MKFNTSSQLLASLFVLAMLFAAGVGAQDGDVSAAGADSEEAVPVEPKALEEADQSSLDKKLKVIQDGQIEIKAIALRLEKTEGILQEVFQVRLDEAWTVLLSNVVSFSEQVADLRDAGYIVTDYEPEVISLLERITVASEKTVARHQGRIMVPDSSASPAEQAAADEEFFTFVRSAHETYSALIDSTEVAARFEMDTSAEVEYLRTVVSEGAANLSAYLDMSMKEAAGLAAGKAAIPDDTDILARSRITDLRIRRLASEIELKLSSMGRLDLPTAQYEAQLLAATGEITASIFDLEVIAKFFGAWSQSVVDYLTLKGPGFLFQVLIFFIIVYVFSKIAKLVQKALNHAMDHSSVKVSELLRRMISSSSKNLILLIGILIALSQLGITLGPLLAGLGIAGFIVGFALQDSLSNFASGMMILLYRPFDVGDTIEAAATRGRVSEMSLVNTTILTFDNQSLIVPNNQIWQNVIRNVTAQTQLRVDMTFGITYDEDIDRVEKLLLELVAADPRVLKDPEPVVKVGSFGDSSVNLLCRPWVKTDDYWEVFWDLNKVVKQAFDREGITIPFPQRDVHVFNDSVESAKAEPEKDQADGDRSGGLSA